MQYSVQNLELIALKDPRRVPRMESNFRRMACSDDYSHLTIPLFWLAGY
jgi:hypothetical protein